ncbi:MAG: deoxyribonuclease V [bacterium]|jgi:deoxyribonuclease V|nr:deoxyribonuclease V [candidate division KSB1 bacterium]MDH7558734.1 deoxyribonuclease V [bacterium]
MATHSSYSVSGPGERDSGEGSGEGSHPLCPPRVSVSEARAVQAKMAGLLGDGKLFEGPVATIAAGDVAYARHGDRVWAAVVLYQMSDLSLIEFALAEAGTSFPYVPGLLSFREGPVLLKAFSLLRSMPDVALFDGQGTAHPRGLGLASHMGLCLGLPTVGCAKSRLVGEHAPVGMGRGAFSWLMLNGQKVGAAVRTRAGVKPVYVSAGHRMSQERAIQLVLATSTRYRLPEPLRQAHLLASRCRDSEE